MKILGLDPGKRSGIALVEFHANGDYELHRAVDVAGSVDAIIGHFQYYREQYTSCDMWVIENFTKREGVRGVKDDASRVIGAVLALADEWGVKTRLQPPGGRLRRVPDRVLTRLFGPLKGNKNRNIKEALRHAVNYAKVAHVKVVLDAFEEED